MQIIRNLMGGGRKSNIEVLRLLCMLMILNLHSFWGYEHGNGVLRCLDFFRESLCICAVDVFLIISGYFGIKWKFKSFWNLIFQIFYYAFGVYIVAVLIGVIDFNLHDFISNFQALYASWGFVTGYIILYFCSPFLNVYSDIMDKRKLLLTIIILFIVEHFVCRDHHFSNYCIMYLIGRLLNKMEVKEVPKRALCKYFIVSVVMTTVVVLIDSFTNINIQTSIVGNVIGYSYESPLVIIQSVFLFLAFANISFQSNTVNWLSESCFAIFLIHMHPAIKQIGYYNYTESLYNLPTLQHALSLLLLIIVVFFGSIFVDKVRIIISNLCYQQLLRIKRFLPNKLFVAETYLPKTISKLL